MSSKSQCSQAKRHQKHTLKNASALKLIKTFNKSQQFTLKLLNEIVMRREYLLTEDANSKRDNCGKIVA